jgi:hypothetical protein
MSVATSPKEESHERAVESYKRARALARGALGRCYGAPRCPWRRERMLVPRLLDGGSLLLPTAAHFENPGWRGEVLADDGEAEGAILVGDFVPTREQAVANAMEAIANWEPVE